MPIAWQKAEYLFGLYLTCLLRSTIQALDIIRRDGVAARRQTIMTSLILGSLVEMLECKVPLYFISRTGMKVPNETVDSFRSYRHHY